MTDAVRAPRWMAECETLDVAGGAVAYRSVGSGPPVVLVHGFPTWSFDWFEVAADLARDHRVVTLDLPGYGASAKPRRPYSVPASADAVEAVLAHLGLDGPDGVDLVVHDYGATVGQELMDRRRRGVLGFDVASLTVFNGGIVYRAYRPTRMQRLLATPALGGVLSSVVTGAILRRALDGVRGVPLGDEEFADLWYGISRNGGHRISHLLLGYIAERKANEGRWESAFGAYDGPLHLVWGPLDPVSGAHVLAPARAALPRARVTELAGVGHFPMSEDPAGSIAAIRAGLADRD